MTDSGGSDSMSCTNPPATPRLTKCLIECGALAMRAWFEYVPSEQNVADLPSRDGWDKFYEILDLVCPESWRCTQYGVLQFSDFSTWEAPLKELPRYKRRRHGSRGSHKARKR